MRRKTFIMVLFIIFFLLMHILVMMQVWRYAIWETEYGSFVSSFSYFIRARIEILQLKTYDSMQQARLDFEFQSDTHTFVQADSFGIYPEAEYFLVKEKNGWKIEDILQFSRGHKEGISDGTMSLR